MNVGELVLSLGIKGTEKTVGALGGIQKGLKDTASMSLEAKAGIIAAMYALERLFAASGQAGTNLTNFNAITGGSIKTLQQYQYAARQVGVSNQEVESSFKGLQASMTKTLKGEGAPSGLARVSLLTGGISQKDIENYSKNPELLIQRLQQYAEKEKNIGLRNDVLKSFGLGEGMNAALARQAFRPEVLQKAPTYSDKEVGQLDKANIAWSNLGNKIEMAFGHFNAKHGGSLVTDISKIVDQIVKLVEALVKLSEKLKIFDLIGKSFEGWTEILGGVTSSVDKISGAVKDPKKRDQLIQDTVEGTKQLASVARVMGSDLLEGAAGLGSSFLKTMPSPSVASVQKFFSSEKSIQTQKTSEIQKLITSPAPVVNKQALLPQLPHGPVNKTTNQSNQVNITNTFQHPGVDHKRTSDEMKKQVQNAMRQTSAQHVGA